MNTLFPSVILVYGITSFEEIVLNYITKKKSVFSIFLKKQK